MGGKCDICGCDLNDSNRAYYIDGGWKIYYDTCDDCQKCKEKKLLNRHERRKLKKMKG